jgi:hypothetical protein
MAWRILRGLLALLLSCALLWLIWLGTPYIN